MKNLPRLVMLLFFVLVTACRGQETLTVTEVIQNAERLNGKTIRVRGLAYLWTDPSRAEIWAAGGCTPKTDPSYRPGAASGWLTLYDSIDPADLKDYGEPYNRTGLKISESSFHCNGDYCKIKCSSFEGVSQRMYELVGIFRIKAGPEFILENIDLEASSQLIDGTWTSLSTGEFDLMLP